MRFFITLSYSGCHYAGWQIQPNGVTVQEVLQRTLSTILRKDVKIIGAGRTDSGVHARKMVAHFDWEGKSFSKRALTKKLNSLLPKDIAVQQIREVKSDVHARFSALSRTYKYYITTKKDPFLYPFKLRLYHELNMEAMNTLCSVLFEYEDFSSFSKLHSAAVTNICRIYEAYWEEKDGEYVFTIKADRFLRNMVRAVVGTLMVAGRGGLDEQGFRAVIEGKNRCLAGNSAPAHGLFLEEVEYPEDIWL